MGTEKNTDEEAMQQESLIKIMDVIKKKIIVRTKVLLGLAHSAENA